MKKINAGEPDERLPTMREMMRHFATAQRTVELALHPFLESGELSARPGAGIVIGTPASPEKAEQWEGDLLVLYRISDSRLAHNVLQETGQRLKQRGFSVLQIGYSSEEKALSVLEKIGRFKTCLLQIHFEVLSIEFLAALHKHAKNIVVDGVSAVGINVDAIGTNWREALSIAFRTLQQRGHTKIGFLTSAHQARQIAMARREYHLLCDWLPGNTPGCLIEIDKLPGAIQIDDIKSALTPLIAEDGSLPFTALIAWGIVEGYLLERALSDLNQKIGVNLSVILLGSIDNPSEHIQRFDVVGNSQAQKLDTFEKIIIERIEMSEAAHEVHYLDIGAIENGSVETL
ncbi:MAG: hypothetical protein ACU0CA_17530 [Paracoccaceae bacterium]